jgi:hypothetical protein
MKKQKKQTAVEWLQSIELERDLTLADWKQAKERDKEQKLNMFNCGRQYQLTGEGTFKQVYQEIYGENEK